MSTAPSPTDPAIAALAEPKGSLLDSKFEHSSFGKWGIIGFSIMVLIYIGRSLIVDLAVVHTASVFPYILLGIALFIALSFEFVNGFHDTANAVATVIYTYTASTKSRRPRKTTEPSKGHRFSRAINNRVEDAFLAAAGRSEAEGETTELLSFAPPQPPDRPHAKPPAVRAGPGPVKPPTTQKTSKHPVNKGDLYFQNLA
jgi:hypothetical protein